MLRIYNPSGLPIAPDLARYFLPVVSQIYPPKEQQQCAQRSRHDEQGVRPRRQLRIRTGKIALLRERDDYCQEEQCATPIRGFEVPPGGSDPQPSDGAERRRENHEIVGVDVTCDAKEYEPSQEPG